MELNFSGSWLRKIHEYLEGALHTNPLPEEITIQQHAAHMELHCRNDEETSLYMVSFAGESSAVMTIHGMAAKARLQVKWNSFTLHTVYTVATVEGMVQYTVQDTFHMEGETLFVLRKNELDTAQQWTSRAVYHKTV
ncbi:MAG: hypothetical protein J0I09_07925 [Sphingobacteriia bacterium]|nr:hypothetical protein [Sphingobacteriia bacterium]